jgi:hypothetical protein
MPNYPCISYERRAWAISFMHEATRKNCSYIEMTLSVSSVFRIKAVTLSTIALGSQGLN